MEDYVSFLRRLVERNGFAFVDVIREAANENGYTMKQMKVARQILGYKSMHIFDDEDLLGNWFWCPSD